MSYDRHFLFLWDCVCATADSTVEARYMQRLEFKTISPKGTIVCHIVLYRAVSCRVVSYRIVSISTLRIFLRSSFLGWPGFVRTTAAARLACWRNSGPPSSSPASTAPFPATPTSTSTSCRPWLTWSTSTGGTWWWPPSPLLTTGTQTAREAKRHEAEGSKCG